MNESLLSELLDEYKWLYRGVPAESDEVESVATFGDLNPPRPDRTGERWRQLHIADSKTDTGYTSWTTDRSIAVDAATWNAEAEDLSGGIRIFRVRLDSLSDDRLFEGRGDECEYLIEGRVEEVTFSDDPTMEEVSDD
jgi:hypothetical protein